MTGAELALELERRKGQKPSPVTIYPVLKYLKDRGLLVIDENKSYSLSEEGRTELDAMLDRFFLTFCDVDEMRARCKCHE